MSTDAELMNEALIEARVAGKSGEIPIGAVVVRDGQIIARGSNRNLLDHDPTGHAEMVALREAGRKLGNHRLNGCELFVTMEPCAMCAGALIHARIARIVYGAADPKAGAVTSVMQVTNHSSLNHKMIVKSGVLDVECSDLVQDFFRERRAERKSITESS